MDELQAIWKMNQGGCVSPLTHSKKLIRTSIQCLLNGIIASWSAQMKVQQSTIKHMLCKLLVAQAGIILHG
jgi:hypothetical protein